MKKIFLILSSFSLTPFSTMSMISCQDKKQDFISATIDSNILSLMFKNYSDIQNEFPINFEYLAYHNKTWSEEGYEDIIGSLKITHPLITKEDYASLTNDDKDFVNKISKYFPLADEDENYANLTGLTLNIENTFINTLSFTDDFKQIKLNATCAVTLSKGWESFAKSVIVVDLGSEYYSKYDSLKLVNYFIKKTSQSIEIYDGIDSDNNKCYYISGNENFDSKAFEKNFNSEIKEIYSSITLSDFSYTLSDDEKYFTLNDVKYYIMS